jgi:hypothetical protein
MKMLFSILFTLGFALFLVSPQAVHADRFEVLYKNGNQWSEYLSFSEGEEAHIISFQGNFYSNYKGTISYKPNSGTEQTIYNSATLFGPENTLIIPGPGQLRIHGQDSRTDYWVRILVKIKTTETTSTTAKYATVIPENAQTDVNVVLEQSTDLVNWSATNPGEFTPSAQKRFFRLRSANVPVAVTGASNASPIVVTSAGHSLNTGDAISISGVAGNTAANGTFTVTKVDANTFSLNGSTGNAAYTSGGTWLPSP